MKKYMGIFLAAALLCSLCGCNSNNIASVDMTESETLLLVTDNYETVFTDVPETSFFTETETAAETTSVPETSVTEETTAQEDTLNQEETTVTEREYMPYEDILIGLISYIQHGCEGYCPSDMGNYLGVYDFMKDFRIDGYSYWHRGGGVYDVKLTCSESSCDMFPDGDSYWIFERGNFYPAENENKIIFPSDMSDVDELLDTAFRAAYDFSVCTGEFEADEEWFENYTDVNIHWLYHVYNPYIEQDEHGGVLIEDFINATKKLYNITIDKEMHRDYFDRLEQIDIAEGEMLYPYRCGHGGSWLYEAFAGYDETDEEIKVRVDYYGDEYYFYAVVESEYTFSKNEDGTITLQRVEKLFDKGYKPAGGSI